jgi:hypothetical protein
LAPQLVTVTHLNRGTTSLSFSAESVEGNYNGAKLNNAVQVVAKQGFEVFKRVPGTKNDLLGDLFQEKQDAFIVQSQPTSHLSRARFMLLCDLPVDRDISISILSSDNAIVSPRDETVLIQTVSILKDTQGPVVLTVQHGGTAGSAFISFRVETVGGNYGGVESGNVKVLAMPLIIFSTARVNIQTDGVGVFTIRPGSTPSQDVTIQCISSNPAVASSTPIIVWLAADGISPNNTKTVTLVYRKQGSVTVSFFASVGSGGNYDGLVWIDGVVAASRPGFLVSATILSVPYHGQVSFTICPDTLPTESAFITVTSSQRAKAAATEESSSFVLQAGRQDTYTITIKSWCSSSPGNCARAGATIIGFEATALPAAVISGNYDGVISARTITAFVEAPRLLLGHGNMPDALLIQSETGVAEFIVRPAQPVNVDMLVSIRAVDASVCSVPQSLTIPAGSHPEDGTSTLSTFGGQRVGNVKVSMLSVGETIIEVSVDSPGDSKFFKIDPVVLPVRSLAGFEVSSKEVSIQAGTSIVITIEAREF